MSPTTLVTGAFGQVGKRCTEIMLRRGTPSLPWTSTTTPRTRLPGHWRRPPLRVSELQDDFMAAVDIGRLGPSVGLPGEPDDDLGWAFTGWFDTTESQALLDYQKHDWTETVACEGAAMGHQRLLLRALGPVAAQSCGWRSPCSGGWNVGVDMPTR